MKNTLLYVCLVLLGLVSASIQSSSSDSVVTSTSPLFMWSVNGQVKDDNVYKHFKNCDHEGQVPFLNVVGPKIVIVQENVSVFSGLIFLCNVFGAKKILTILCFYDIVISMWLFITCALELGMKQQQKNWISTTTTTETLSSPFKFYLKHSWLKKTMINDESTTKYQQNKLLGSVDSDIYIYIHMNCDEMGWNGPIDWLIFHTCRWPLNNFWNCREHTMQSSPTRSPH